MIGGLEMKEYFEVSIMGEKITEIEKGTTYEELAKKYQHKFKHRIVLAKNKNVLRELRSEVKNGDDICFQSITDKDGMRVYTRSVSFLLVKAVKDVLGMFTDVMIESSIKKNYYCEFIDENIKPTEELLEKIEARMKELVAEDVPIVKETFKKDDAIAIVEQFGMYDKARLFKYRRASNVNLYKIGNFYDYFYGYMVPSTGYLTNFHLMPYENGFLILFPMASDPERLGNPGGLRKITEIFMEQMNWARLMKVSNVADLNDLIADGKFGELVRINEALHEKKIAYIADIISSKIDKIKVVLIAGPSSSGKTTFAQRLCVQLRVNGITPHAISLDDYFIDRDNTPVDEFGKHDFENINALDTEQFNEDMNRLIAGERVHMPYYNFVTGKREYKGNFKTLNDGEIFVIEGIHGLNDKLTENIKDENKFKIFISPMTQLNIDNHNRISTTDSRLIRRMVRDYHFRGSSAKATIDTWDYVTRGEERNIFPFQENADIMFNSTTIYELCVLKPYIEPLLFKIDKSMPEYVTAKRIIKFLDYFLSAGVQDIPNNSIIKEFVGGSCFNV